MANPGLFKDLGKEAQETLLKHKEFSAKHQLELAATASNGLKSTAKVTKEDSGAVLGSLELKFPKREGVEGSVSLDSAQKFKGTVSLADKLLHGLKASLTLEDEPAKKERIAKAGLEYRRPYVTGGVTFNFPVRKEVVDPETDTPSLTLSVVGGHEVYGTVGAEGELSLGLSKFKSHTLDAQLRYGSFIVNGFSRTKGGKKPSHICGVNFYNKFVKAAFQNFEVAAELQYDTLASSEKVALLTGVAFDLVADTRVNVTLDTRGKLLAQLTHRVNANTKLRVGSELSPFAVDAQPRFYVALSFTD